jgi:hypothetical protein
VPLTWVYRLRGCFERLQTNSSVCSSGEVLGASSHWKWQSDQTQGSFGHLMTLSSVALGHNWTARWPKCSDEVPVPRGHKKRWKIYKNIQWKEVKWFFSAIFSSEMYTNRQVLITLWKRQKDKVLSVRLYHEQQIVDNVWKGEICVGECGLKGEYLGIYD